MNLVKRNSINKSTNLFFVALFFAVVFLSILVITPSNSNFNAEAAFSFSGSGTEQDPFLIGSVSELLELSNKVNHAETPENTEGLVFALSDNIDMSLMEEGVVFNPIGTLAHPFAGKLKGSYGGQTHVIVNLFTEGNGLFGYTASTAVIDGIGIANATIGDNYAVSNVGGIVGVNLGTVTNCFFYGTVKGINNVGGLVGINGADGGATGTVSFSYGNGTIIASGTYVGGVVGKNYYQMNCTYSLSKIEVSYWPGNNYDGNIGGVLGGRMPGYNGYNTTPAYSYFYKGNNDGNMDAIGFGTSRDTVEVPDDPNHASYRFAGLSGEQFGSSTQSPLSKTLTDLFGLSYEGSWIRKYSTTDYSAWYAPVLKNRVPTSNVFLENLYFKNSVAIRRYGYTHNQFEWGTVDNPYLIENVEQFNNLALSTQNSTRPESYLNKFFLQKNNLNFQGISPNIVGKKHESNYPFSGTYDGGFKTISNFNLTDTPYVTQNDVGLFGYINASSTVKNIVLNDSCVFIGKSRVGSIVGYSNGGRVINVWSKASVKATVDYGGGIIGQAATGVYTNILSDPSFSSVDPLLISKHKGIFGTSNNTTLKNIWYLDNPANNQGVSSTSGQGNILHFSTAYGDISASLAETGQISFISTPDSSWSSSFRNVNEEEIATGNEFLPSIDETRKNLEYYLRFVKTIEVELVDLEGNTVDLHGTLEDGDFGFIVSPALSTKYWVGQRFSVNVDISNTTLGYYVDNTQFFNSLDETIASPAFLEHTYDNYLKKASIRTEMVEELSTFKIVIGEISLTSTAFNSPKTYTGEEVYTFSSADDLVDGGPAGFSFSVDYYGVSPINATSNGRLAVIYSKNNVIRGKLDKTYVILPKELSVTFTLEDHSVVQTIKEFDGIGGVDDFGDRIFQPTTVNQSKIIGVAPADIDNLLKLRVNAQISYIAPDVNPNETISVIVKFALVGTSSANYISPSQVEGSYGGITKRLIKIVISSPLEKQYDGLVPSPPPNYYIDYRLSPIPDDMRLNGSPKFTFTPDNNPSVGTYPMTVNFADPSDGNIYTIAFQDPNNSQLTVNQLNYNITPRACLVEYLGFEESYYSSGKTGSIVYNPSRLLQYNANFIDIASSKHLLEKEFWENGAALGSNPSEAGTYTVYIQEQVEDIYGLNSSTTKNYYLVNPELTFHILQAEQNDISINSLSTVDFDEVYQISSTGGSGTGETIYLTYESINNTAQVSIEGNSLTSIKAGNISLIARKGESRNYKSKDSAPFILTINKVNMDLSLNSKSITYRDDLQLDFIFNQGLSTIPGGFIRPTIHLSKGLSSILYQEETIYDVGEYTILIAEDASSYGYTFSLSQEIPTLTISKLQVNVTAEDKTQIYGQAEIPLTFLVDDEEITLQGALSRENGVSVGDYAISKGNLSELNLNFDIVFSPGTYSITPATLKIIIEAKTKNFGDPDPVPTFSVEGLASNDTALSIGLQGTILRALGENAYKQGFSTPSADYTYYAGTGDKAFTHTSQNYNPTINVQNATLRILPISPSFENIVPVKVQYGNTLSNALYGNPGVSEMPSLASARGRRYVTEEGRWEEKIVEGTYVWKNTSERPDYAQANTYTAKARFNPLDRNYKITDFDIVITPIRVALTLTFTGETSYVYDGLEHKEMSFRFNGVLGSDDVRASVTYNGDVKNVGRYRATLTINNGNYIISNSNSINIDITPKELVIGHPDIKVAKGATPVYAFTYEGFIAGESYLNLTTSPVIVYVDEVGLYEGIRASRASADNYSITYTPFNLRVLAIELVPQEDKDNILVNGVFEDGIISQCEVVETGLEYKNMAGKFEAAKAIYTELASTMISTMYLIKFTNSDGEVVQDAGAKTMTIELSEEQVEKMSTYKFFGVTSSGDMILLDEPSLSGNLATFDIEGLSSIMFLEPAAETFNMMYLYIGIGVVAGLLVAIAIIITIVKSKERKRVIAFKKEEI